MNAGNVSNRLKIEHERLKSWDAVAAQYSDETFKMHKVWVWALATKGMVPANLEACYRLGLRKRPKPKPAPTAFQLILRRMAADTWAALKGWRL